MKENLKNTDSSRVYNILYWRKIYNGLCWHCCQQSNWRTDTGENAYNKKPIRNWKNYRSKQYKEIK